MGFNLFNFGSSTNWKEEFVGTVVTEGVATIDNSGITGLNVQWIAGEVEVVYHNYTDIRLEQTCNKTIPEDRLMVYRIDSDGMLWIREGAGKKVNSSTDTILTVYLPIDTHFRGDFSLTGISSDVTVPKLTADGDVYLRTVSGDITLQKATVGRGADIASTSGDIEILSLTTGMNALVSTTSGDILIQNGVIDGDADVSSTNGDIEFNLTTGGKLEVSTVSGELAGNAGTSNINASSVNGNICLQGAIGGIVTSNVNGDTDVVTSVQPVKAELGSTNGDITLTLPETVSGFAVEYGTVNGDFTCDFPCITGKGSATYGDGSTKIDMSTVNGEISISSK